jgi:hypothetical protein
MRRCSFQLLSLKAPSYGAHVLGDIELLKLLRWVEVPLDEQKPE